MIRYISIFLLLSCNNATDTANESNLKVDTINQLQVVPKDTSITFNLEGISSEGAVTLVRYTNGKISNSVTHIYSGAGQASVTYEFEQSEIKVIEKQFYYKTGIESVKSDDDMQLAKEISYSMDWMGTPKGNFDKDRSDIYFEFKAVVPFELK